MRIILDGMGGDNAPLEIVKGAVEASSKIDHQIVIAVSYTHLTLPTKA